MGLFDFLKMNSPRVGISNKFLDDHRFLMGKIGIARDFCVILNDDNTLSLLGKNDVFRQLPTNERIVKVAAAFAGYMGLTESGHVVTCGSAHEFERSRDIERWQNLRDVTSCEGHSVALMRNGSVECIDEPGGWEGVPNHSHVVRDWHNIKQVAVGFTNIMGLTNDGRVLNHSEDGFTNPHFYDNFSDIVQVDCYSHYYGTDSSMVLHRDGTVSSNTFEGVDSWRNIIQISVGADVAIGLKADGTVEMVDNRNTRYDVKNWTNLVCIVCKFFSVVGITKEGEVLSILAQP